VAGLTEEGSIGVLGKRLLGRLCCEADLPQESICSCLAFRIHARRGCSLAEWSQHKFSLEHQSVWQLQSLVLHDDIPIEKNIEVDVSRSFVDDFDSSHPILDCLQLI
jgi:hypothetical protein